LKARVQERRRIPSVTAEQELPRPGLELDGRERHELLFELGIEVDQALRSSIGDLNLRPFILANRDRRGWRGRLLGRAFLLPELHDAGGPCWRPCMSEVRRHALEGHHARAGVELGLGALEDGLRAPTPLERGGLR
jgi:hypothetical protein